MAFLALEVTPGKPAVMVFGEDTMAGCAVALRNVRAPTLSRGGGCLSLARGPLCSSLSYLSSPSAPLSLPCFAALQASLASGGACRLTITTVNHNAQDVTAVLAVLRPGVYENHAMNTAFGYDPTVTLTFAVEAIAEGPGAKGLGPPCVHLTGFIMREVEEEDDEEDGEFMFVRAPPLPVAARAGPSAPAAGRSSVSTPMTPPARAARHWRDRIIA